MNEVGFSWTVEETQAVLLLAGFQDQVSLFGFSGLAGADAPGLEFGVRGLRSRGLVEVDHDEVRLVQLAVDVARCACIPTEAGLLLGMSGDTYDIAAYGVSEGKVLACAYGADGVVVGTVYEGELVDRILTLVGRAGPLLQGQDWSLAVRVRPVDRELIDVFVGNDCLGLTAGESVVEASEADVRAALMGALR